VTGVQTCALPILDIALMDVIGDAETIKRVYHIKAKPEDFYDSMKNLKKAGVALVPHIVVGMDYGRIKGEFKALEMVRDIKPDALVLVGLMPMKGTLMACAKPPSVEDFAKIIALSRLMMPKTPIILGCARDRKGKPVLDIHALRCGVNGIAHPSGEAIKEAKAAGFDITFEPTCCAELALMSR
jgi:uncharacterized radical SAM superfamily protein